MALFRSKKPGFFSTRFGKYRKAGKWAATLVAIAMLSGVALKSYDSWRGLARAQTQVVETTVVRAQQPPVIQADVNEDRSPKKTKGTKKRIRVQQISGELKETEGRYRTLGRETERQLKRWETRNTD